jgi:hypothetical protein
MGETLTEITPALNEFIARQHLFFVATAPAGSGGHVNVSPKGLDGFRVLGPTRVAYLDYPGSGVETIAHLRENGRIVLMFCAFDGPPKIVRLHGKGRTLEPRDPEFVELLPHFSNKLGVRSIIQIDVTRVSTSCGHGVPTFEYVGERDQLVRWGEKKGADGLELYQRTKNVTSIDGLPGLRWVTDEI